MPDEPGRCDEAATEVESKTQNVPIENERGSGGRQLGGPPVIGEQSGRPTSQKQEGDERYDDGDEPPAAPGQLYLTA
jgi:hypothetical protein